MYFITAYRTGSTKPRRPDRAVYVPRALRQSDNTSPEENKTDCATRRTIQSPDDKCPKSPGPKDKSANGTPRKSLDKNFCNVYVPPHLRNQRSHTAPSIDVQSASIEANDSVPSGFQVPNSDSAIQFSDDSCYTQIDVGNNFYIGDYFANGQLGFYSPNYFEYADLNHDCTAESEWTND